MSYFNRPWRDQSTPESDSSHRAATLAADWKTLETRIAASNASALQSLQIEVNDFLRHWNVALAGLPASEKAALESLLTSAGKALNDQIARLDRAAVSQQTETAQRAAHEAQRRLIDDARHQDQMARARENIQRLNRETDEINAQTLHNNQVSTDRNHLLQKAALFPENHCPVCSRAYAEMTGGCWHCQQHQRPRWF